MARSPATWLNPSRKMMDLLDERGAPPAAVEVDAVLEGVEFVVRVDLPGIDPDRDLCLRITHGRLLVTGDRPRDLGARGSRERRRGRFAREVPLPTTASGDATTTYVDGVLEVRISLRDDRTAPTVVPVRHPVLECAVRRGPRAPVRRPTVRSADARQVTS